MKNNAKRYTNHEKEFLLNLVKVSAQNGIHPEDAAESVAPILRRKPSAIVVQMNVIRAEWLRSLQQEMIVANQRVQKWSKEETPLEEPLVSEEPLTFDATSIVTENNADSALGEPVDLADFVAVTDEPEDAPVEPGDHVPIQDGDVIEVVVQAIKEYGAFVSGTTTDIYGLLHISNIAEEFVENVDDYLYVGQKINARMSITRDGRYAFTTKDVPDANVWMLA